MIGEELRLAPPAPALPPRLHVQETEFDWFALDWNTEELSSVLPAAPENAIQIGAASVVQFTLKPAAEPIGFEVAVFEGTLGSADPSVAPAQLLDCLEVHGDCRLEQMQGETQLVLENLAPGPHVLVINARYFAPPKVNPDRVANEASWLVELQPA